MTNILVVECAGAAAEKTMRELRLQGYAASRVDSGEETLARLDGVDLVLLSLDLPDVDGLRICRSLRSASDVPLIARTRREDGVERVLALKEGADDCVVTAWGFREVGARIEAVLRRSRSGRADPSRSIALDPLRVDPRTREVRLHGRLVEVTSKEFDLLYTLAANPDAVLSRKELMARVWGSDWAYASRTIDTHVSSLRAKLGCSRWVVTVRGVGYRIGRSNRVPAPSPG